MLLETGADRKAKNNVSCAADLLLSSLLLSSLELSDTQVYEP